MKICYVFPISDKDIYGIKKFYFEVPMKSDAWNPQQYKKFQNERNRPFEDLLKLILAKPGMRIVDLGCGTGELTKHLHEELHAASTLGIDSSSAMLKEAQLYQASCLSFKQGSIEQFDPFEKYDLIFSNAALQWVPNHKELFSKFSTYLKPQGQIAIQVPDNYDFPTHAIAREIASKEPFNEIANIERAPTVLSLIDYANLFYKLGFTKQNLRSQIYSHQLESTQSVIEWVQGSLLTHYRSCLPPDIYAQFFECYRKRIYEHFGDQRPFFFPFKRTLLWVQQGQNDE